MHVEIITPDRTVYQGEATSVRFPGTDGSFEVLNHHAAMIAVLGPGELRILPTAGGEQHVRVEGGVVEVLNNQVTVLAEGAVQGA